MARSIAVRDLQALAFTVEFGKLPRATSSEAADGSDAMDDLNKLMQVVGAIHRASIDAGGWTGALNLVADLLRCDGVALALEDEQRSFGGFYEVGNDPEAQNAYLQEFHAIDPVIAFVRRSPARRAYTEAMAIAREELDRSRFYADFAARFGYHHCIQAYTHRAATSSGLFGAARSRRRGPFEKAECELLEMLLPHFEQALHVRAMLHEADLEKRGALAALDQIGDGVILVDDELKIRFANAEAGRILRCGGGLQQLGSKLKAVEGADHARLQKAVALAAKGICDPSSAAFPVTRGPASSRLLLRVVPTGTRACGQASDLEAGALVFIGDPGAGRIDPALLAASLALTPAEAEVASLLACGLDVDAVTLSLRISIPTLRTHLRHIFAKTQTSQQSQLVALVRAVPRPAMGTKRSPAVRSRRPA